MKKAITVIILLLVAIVTFGQVTDSTTVVTYTQGNTLMEFWQKNMWSLIALVFFLVSEWLGSTGKVKEGSVWAWLINFIGKILKNKSDLVKTKKAKFLKDEELVVEAKSRNSVVFKTLKILIAVFILSGLTMTVKAQSAWDGFFQPVKSNAQLTKAVGDKKYEFKFRPAAEMTAVQVMYDKETKTWNSNAFNSAGIGLGLQHYVEGVNGPVNNYGFNALLMMNAFSSGDKGAGFGAAVTINVPNFVTFGGGYDFTFKQPYILLGAVYNF
jgi:hypothetical protein